GWNFAPVQSGGIFNPHDASNTFYDPAGLAQVDGENVAYSNGGVICQTLTTDLAANTLYTLSVLVGDRKDVNNDGNDFSVSLYAGSTLLATTTKSDYATFDDGFIPATALYLSGSSVSADPLKIVLWSKTIQYNFDDVQLDATAVNTN